MAQQFQELSERHQSFIEEQKVFFVGTAGKDRRVNISPKGLDSLKVLGRNRVAWLNVTGSGNETAAHVIENPRMTLMFMSLTGAPMILRLYGTAKVVHRTDLEWSSLIPEFPPLPGARQIFDLAVDLVQTSCGMAVPLYDYVANRTELTTWSEKAGEEKMRQYWLDRNTKSIDGRPTGIEKNA